ncbi:MAG: beta-lactamase family protein [Alphaproteobacteria bacterium]|nr:beta-lactamase family protein [Alphaproteobacteria bacterium]
MTHIHGTTDSKFSKLKDALASCHADGIMQGGSVAVVLDGKPVAELWCGQADAAGQKPWARDTLVNVWSCTKGVLATAVAMAVERGRLRHDMRLAEVWPEFAANGKQDITLEQVMTHRSGLNGITGDVAENIYLDWPRAVRAIEAMAPNYVPGTVCAYHALSIGTLAGETLRRSTGKMPGAFIREEIAGPLGADFHVGVAAADDARCAEMIAGAGTYEWVEQVSSTPYPQGVENPRPDALAPNARAWRAAEIPGANGHATALGLATIYGDLTRAAPKLLTKVSIAEAIRSRFRGRDAGFEDETCWAAGFRLEDAEWKPRASGTTFGHGGWGGAFGFGDPEAGLGFAFTTNHMLGFGEEPDQRRQRLINAVYDAV